MYKKIADTRRELSALSRREDKNNKQIQVLEKVVFNKDEDGMGFDVFDKIESRLFKLEKMSGDIENKVNINCTQMISKEFKELRFQMDED